MTKKSTFLITYRDYEISNNSVIFRLFGRDTNGKHVTKHVSGTFPYFYVPEGTKIPPDQRIVRTEPSDIPFIFGGKCTKIIARKPSDVAGANQHITYLRDLFDITYEADVLYGHRCAIDYDLNGIIETPAKPFINIADIAPSQFTSIKPRTHTFDIENCDDGTIEDARKGEKEVYVITVHDSQANIYHIFTSFQLSEADQEKIKATIYEHWKDNELFPDLANSEFCYHMGNDEPEMFNLFYEFEEQNRPDIISGFNTNGFDIPVVYHRSKKIGVDETRLSPVRYVEPNRSRISGINCMDIQELYQKYSSHTVMYPSLEYVAGKELKSKKLPRVSIRELYRTDRAHLVAYNIIDVQLTVAIDHKISLINRFTEVAISSYSSFQETNRSTYIDNLILKEAHGKMILPTKKKVKRKKDDLMGGGVLDSTPGTHENVLVLDYAGMYTSIMMALNISPETKSPDGDIIAVNGVRFKSKPEGLLPSNIKKCRIKRTHYKKLMKQAEMEYGNNPTPQNKVLIQQYSNQQLSEKVLGNSYYGQLGFSNFRLIDIEVANAVTSSGQFLLFGCRDYLINEKFYYKENLIKLKVIYGDTDSVFVKVFGDYTPEELREISFILIEKVNLFIDKTMKEKFNVIEHGVEIEYDKIFQKLFQVPPKDKKKGNFGAKKKYIGYTYNFDDDGNFAGVKEEIKGFEIVRANSVELTKKLQRTLLFDYILKGKSKSEIREMFLKLHSDLFNNKIPQEDLGMRAELKKNLNEYGNKPEINAMRNTKRYLKRSVEVGDVFTIYAVSKSPMKYLKHKLIALNFDEELLEGYEIDKDEIWRKFVKLPTETILEAYGLNFDYIITGKEIIKLSKFFNIKPKITINNDKCKNDAQPLAEGEKVKKVGLLKYFK